MKISLIVACGNKRQIGLNGKIPFESDFKRFKYLTLGKTLLMGRKTFESVGRALPGRETIVLTRQKDYKAKDAFIASNYEDVIKLSRLIKTSELMVCGGEKLYEFFMPIADSVYITRIDYDGLGDTFFPRLKGNWMLYYEEKGKGSTFKIYNKNAGK